MCMLTWLTWLALDGREGGRSVWQCGCVGGMAPGDARIWRPWTVDTRLPLRCAAVAVAGDWKADEVALAFGGVAPVTVMAPEAAAALTGNPWTEQTLRAAVAALARDIAIAPNAPGAALWVGFSKATHMALSLPCSEK